MKRLSKKLRSERGASILMALMMLLVCMMVAASVLAATASNAGKARSNRVEQQKYLTLSSAIQLVADEIQKAKYTGKYKVYEWTVDTEEKDGAGNVINTTSEDFFYIEQVAGVYSCDQLTDQLPLGKELDEIFSGQFTGTGYKALSGTEGSEKRTLTVSLPYDSLDTTKNLVGYPYPADPDPTKQKPYEISKDVTVQVVLDHSTHHITLTAWLGNGEIPAGSSDTMIAELVAKDVPVLDYNTAGKTACGSEVDIPESVTGSDTPIDTPMTWELHWIKKGAA